MKIAKSFETVHIDTHEYSLKIKNDEITKLSLLYKKITEKLEWYVSMVLIFCVLIKYLGGKEMEKKGISLVALIVTIIVLVILSGTVMLVAGNNGILQYGMVAVDKWNDRLSIEDMVLDNMESELLSMDYKTWREIADTQVSDYTKLTQEEFALLFQGGDGTEGNPYRLIVN